MLRAQIVIYSEDVDADGVPIGKWGYRKTVFVDPPESFDDTGLIYEDRDTAFSAAVAENSQGWPIG